MISGGIELVGMILHNFESLANPKYVVLSMHPSVGEYTIRRVGDPARRSSTSQPGVQYNYIQGRPQDFTQGEGDFLGTNLKRKDQNSRKRNKTQVKVQTHKNPGLGGSCPPL